MKFRARPNQPLEQHLLKVSELAKKFATKIGLAQHGELIGLLHDFGKYSKKFQDYICSIARELNFDIDNDCDNDDSANPKDLKGKIDHSTAGAQWIWQQLKKYGDKGQGELCAQILTLCIASHHSGLIDCLKPDGNNNFNRRINKDNEETNYKECCENADDIILKKAKQLATGKLVTAMLKRINIKLLFNSKKELIADFYLGFFTRFLFSCLIDADRIDSARVENPDILKIFEREIDWLVAIDRLETYLMMFETKNSVDQLRQKISDVCYNKATLKQGIYTLTVPTGGGKTYASLRYALHHAQQHKLDRIIYIIPYTSIIEQNAVAIRKVLENETDEFPWVLEHHSNLEPEKETWHSKITSTNWDAPIVLTTMVQFLEVLFGSGTRSVRRLHQLANSVLIFDEIQTLPIKCVHLFCNALNFLVEEAKTTAVLCTATQPLLNQLNDPEKGQLNIPIENELMENLDQLFEDLKRVEIKNKYKPGGWKADEIKALALEEFNSKGSCLVIVNTKLWAQNLYRLCKADVPKEAIFHLSTHQCPAHRKEILATIRLRLENSLPVLCISTQLIEAGVDIDFACVIRFIAGLDSIAQAAGRCNRHGLLRDKYGNLINGIVYIVNPDKENLDLLPEIKIGKEITLGRLDEFQIKGLLNPETMQLYFNYYFFQRRDKMSYDVGPNRIISRNDTLLNLLSDNSFNGGRVNRHAVTKFSLLQQSFMAAGKSFKAIDAPTQAVIIQYEKGKEIVNELCSAAGAKEFNAKKYYELLKQAQQYSVNVFPNEWQNLLNIGAVYEIQNEGIYYLDEQYYSEEFGLADEVVGLMDIYTA